MVRRKVKYGEAVSFKYGEAVSYAYPDDPADVYFSSAFRRMKECGRGPKQCKSLYAQEDILSSCICSFLSLEASINRLFYETFVRTDRRPIRKGIPSNLVKHIQQSWQRTSVRDKFIVLPPLISDYEFQVDAIPFNLFEELTWFRNRLVHPKMLQATITFKVTEIEGISYGGEIINQSSEAPSTKDVFPLTNFATSFSDLSSEDAEKAFEITYRMRMKLFTEALAPPPILLYEFHPGRLGAKIAHSIAAVINLHFGPLSPGAKLRQ